MSEVKPKVVAMQVDLAIIGGGISGAGIARDAAGRGLRVLLVEQSDLGSGTSSASTKLIHGGLRYLEYGELGLVYESLHERERLLRISLEAAQFGHWVWDLHAGRFEADRRTRLLCGHAPDAVIATIEAPRSYSVADLVAGSGPPLLIRTSPDRATILRKRYLRPKSLLLPN